MSRCWLSFYAKSIRLQRVDFLGPCTRMYMHFSKWSFLPSFEVEDRHNSSNVFLLFAQVQVESTSYRLLPPPRCSHSTEDVCGHRSEGRSQKSSYSYFRWVITHRLNYFVISTAISTHTIHSPPGFHLFLPFANFLILLTSIIKIFGMKKDTLQSSSYLFCILLQRKYSSRLCDSSD